MPFKNLFLFFVKKKNSSQTQIDLDKKLVFSLAKSRIPNLKQLKYLSRFLAPREIKIIKILTLVILVTLILEGFLFYTKHVEKVPEEGGEYIEALIGTPLHINPLFAEINDVDKDISWFVFSGLLKYGPRRELVPDLAQNFEVSQDEKIYTFYLRQNVKWHDGENFDADDVIFTVLSIQNPEFKSPLYLSLKGVKIEKIDKYTVKFVLEKPFAPFLSVLTFGILPEHLWYNVPSTGVGLAEYNLKPIGTGPYKFKSLVKDKLGNIRSYHLIKFDDYYGHKPFLEKITFKFYPNFEEAIESLQNREVNGLSFLPRVFKEKLKSKRLNYYSLNLSQYTAVFLNQKNNEFLKNKSLRQALAYSIDREKIVNKVLEGKGKIIYSPILPGYVGYNAENKSYDFDINKAKEILDQAGFKLVDSLLTIDNKEVQINLTTPDKEEFISAAEIIKQGWKNLGIKTEIQIVSKTKIQSEIIRPRAYEAIIYGMSAGYDIDPFSFWHSSQIEDPGLNLSLFSNRHADKALEDARQTNNLEERQKKYFEFQDILTEEAPAVFLYSPFYIYPVDKKVKGIKMPEISTPVDRFIGFEEWYVKTRRVWK